MEAHDSKHRARAAKAENSKSLATASPFVGGQALRLRARKLQTPKKKQ
jgi:hypothetical protein